MDFAIPVDHWVEFEEIEARDKYHDLASEFFLNTENGGDGDTNSNWCAGEKKNHEILGKENGRFRIRRTKLLD